MDTQSQPNTENQETAQASLPGTPPSPAASAPAWPLRRVGLRVLDLARCIDYYTRLGFTLVRDERGPDANGGMGLGAGGQEILSLRSLPAGHSRPPHTAGLYHFAILVPSAAELGSFLQHCRQQHIPIDGASDHLVSQALYLSDPEGNGIEVYADRPRAQWSFQEGQVVMNTLPLDIPGLLKQAQPFDGFSAQTRLGHMHLNVGDLERSTAFYRKLGLNLMVAIPRSAHFLSWEGYHHHLGINIWTGRNARPVEPDVSGIDFFEIQRPDLPAGVLQDPDGIRVVVG